MKALAEAQSQYGDVEDATLGNIQKFKALQQGSETRWFTIGAAAGVLLDSRPMWITVAETYDEAKGTGKVRQVAQDFLSLLKEPSIVSDLALVSAFHKSFVKGNAK